MALFAVLSCFCLPGAWSLTWTTLPSVPYYVEGHAAAAVNDTMYVFGGIVADSASSGYVTSELLALQLDDNLLEPLNHSAQAFRNASGAEAVAGLLGPSMVASGDKQSLLVFGGYSGQQYHDLLFRLDLLATAGPNAGGYSGLGTGWSLAAQTGAVPAKRYRHSAVLLDAEDKMYVFGGTSEAGSGLDDLAYCDVPSDAGANHAWTSVTKAGAWPAPRALHSATILHLKTATLDKRCMYVFGGQDPSTLVILDDLWRFCFDTDSWEALASSGGVTAALPGKSAGHSAVVLSSRLVLFGGYSAEFPDDYLDHLREYDAVLDSWYARTGTEAAGGGRTQHTMAVLADPWNSSAPATTASIVVGGRNRYETVGAVLSVDFVPPVCAAGSYNRGASPDADGNDCETCATGKFSAVAASYVCEDCAAGRYADEQGKSACTLCGAGRYGPNTGAQAASSCQACPAGKATATLGSTAQSACSPCGAGTVAAAGDASCISCGAGTFANGNACTDCVPGKYSGALADSCADCVAGTYSYASKSTACSKCPGGQYSETGKSSCQQCAAGRASAQPAAGGAASCQPCALGQYAAGAGSRYCDACAAGKYHDETGSSAQADCKDCPAGRATAVEATGTCPPCGNGTYASGTGALECQACAAGRFSEAVGAQASTTCLQCPPGTETGAATGVGRSGGCLPCTAGRFSDSAGACVGCPRGRFSAATGAYDLSSCLACKAMTAAPAEGSGACTPCAAGSFSLDGWATCAPCTADGGAALCPAGANLLACSGHGTCTYGRCVCAAGWHGADCSDGATGAGFVQFKQDYLTVGEGTGAGAAATKTVLIELERVIGRAGAVTATIAVSFGGGNIEAITGPPAADQLTATFADGGGNVSVAVDVTSDAVSEPGCRNVTLAIVGLTGGAQLGLRNQTLLLVEDDDYATAQLAAETAAGSLVAPSLVQVLMGTPTPYVLPVTVQVPPTTGQLKLDLLLLQDLSASYSDDLVVMRNLLPNLVSTMQEQFPDPWFGVASYIDKPVTSYSACSVLAGSDMANAGPPAETYSTTNNFGGCDDWEYRTELPLTGSTPLFQSTYAGLNAQGGQDYPESQLSGLLMAARRIQEVGWRTGSRRVVVMITDDRYHEAGDYTDSVGSVAVPANDGDGVLAVGPDGRAGTGEDYPTTEQVRVALQEAEIYPIFFSTTTNGGGNPALSYWQSLATAWGFGVAVEISADSSNLVDAISAAMSAVTSEVALAVQDDPAGIIQAITPASYSGVDPGLNGTNRTFEVSVRAPTIGAAATDPSAVSRATLASLGYGTLHVEAVASRSTCPALVDALTASGAFASSSSSSSAAAMAWTGWPRNADFRDTDRTVLRTMSGNQTDPPYSALHWRRVCRKAVGTSLIPCDAATLPAVPTSLAPASATCGPIPSGVGAAPEWVQDGDFYNEHLGLAEGARALVTGLPSAATSVLDWQVRVRIISGDSAGLVFRSSSNGHALYAYVLNVAAQRAELWRHHDASDGSTCTTRTAVTQSIGAAAVARNTWYTLRVVGSASSASAPAVRSVFSFYLDGALLGVVSDGTLATGQTGVYAWKTKAEFTGFQSEGSPAWPAETDVVAETTPAGDSVADGLALTIQRLPGQVQDFSYSLEQATSLGYYTENRVPIVLRGFSKAVNVQAPDPPLSAEAGNATYRMVLTATLSSSSSSGSGGSGSGGTTEVEALSLPFQETVPGDPTGIGDGWQYQYGVYYPPTAAVSYKVRRGGEGGEK